MRFTPPDAFSYIKGSLIGALPPQSLMSVVKVRGCFYLNEVGIKHDLNTKI